MGFLFILKPPRFLMATSAISLFCGYELRTLGAKSALLTVPEIIHTREMSDLYTVIQTFHKRARFRPIPSPG